jgi:hypothetical protein
MRKVFSPIVAIAILLLLVLAGRHWSGARLQEDTQLQVKNETSSLQVLSSSMEKSGAQNLVKLHVINVSNKAIVAYTILKQDQTMLTTNGATTGWVLAPSESDTVRVLLPVSDKTLTIFAALFEDGSGEGDFGIVKELGDYRTGVKAQFQRAIPILRQLESAVQSRQAASLRNELLNLPERHEGANSSVSKSEGAKHAKQDMLNYLKLHEDSPHDLGESSRLRVRETLKKLEKAVNKL